MIRRCSCLSNKVKGPWCEHLRNAEKKSRLLDDEKASEERKMGVAQNLPIRDSALVDHWDREQRRLQRVYKTIKSRSTYGRHYPERNDSKNGEDS